MDDKMVKLNGKSFDVVGDNIFRLKEIFPEVVNGDNQIDFDNLREILEKDIEVVDNVEEHYKFTWWGKKESKRKALESTTKTLRPSIKDSKNWKETKNIYIEGDNLDALKILLGSYRNRIKMIYIDPPYNTGNKDLIYHDTHAQNKKEHLEKTGQLNEEGKLLENPKTEGKYHSNWLNMMYPRLYLAKKLLTNDGVIFISIDENEFTNLKNICDEIFGESNFVENFIWIKNSTKNLSKTTSTNHEYVMVYAKDINVVSDKKIFRVLKPGFKDVMKILNDANLNKWSISQTENKLKEFYNNNPDLKGISSYNRVDYVEKNGEKILNAFTLSDLSAPKSTGKADTYDIIHPITGKVCKTPSRGWAFKKDKMEEVIKKNLVYFYDDETHVPRFKRYLDTVDTDVIKSTFNDYADGKKELMKLFDGEAYFDNAKPTTLIKKFVDLIEDNSIILDFFSGSGTLAHSIFELNKENKNYKFILIQIQEETDEKSEAYKAGFKNICEIGKERIRRAGDKILEESDNKYLDIGFKVFQIDESNFIPWNPTIKTPEEAEQAIIETANNLVRDRTELDLVYELLLQLNLDLNAKIEEKQINNHKFYVVNNGFLLICLDPNIDESIAKDIINLKEELMTEYCKVILLDKALNAISSINIFNDLDSENIELDTI